jgi:hypothetical protein
MKKQTVVTLVLVLVVIASGIALLRAADFPARQQLIQRSLQQGVAVPQLPLLRATPGPGRQAALDTLKARFASPQEKIVLGGTAQKQTRKKAIILRAPGWILEVAGDGNRVRYRNFAYLEGAANRRVPLAERPKQDELQVKGRQFISAQLRDVIRVGQGEELVPLFTEYQIAGGGSTAAGAKPIPETVGGATVVFGRTIDGVHVIGSGSKVRILFGSDGTIGGFDYDWPEYRRTDAIQKVASVTDVRKRVRQLAGVDVETADVKVERMECGYFDRGSDRRDPAAPLQSACAVFTVERPIVDVAAHARDSGSGHITIAKVSVIPAGETVEPDAKWTLALKFLGRTPSESLAPARGPKPNTR